MNGLKGWWLWIAYIMIILDKKWGRVVNRWVSGGGGVVVLGGGIMYVWMYIFRLEKWMSNPKLAQTYVCVLSLNPWYRR